MAKRAVVMLNLIARNEVFEIDVPLDLSASELMGGLNKAYKLNMTADEVADCYVKAENPVVLMHGKKTLEEYGIVTGSVLNITE